MKYYNLNKTSNYKIALYSFLAISIIVFYLMLKNNPIPILLMMAINAAILTATFLFLKRKFWNKGTGKWQKN